MTPGHLDGLWACDRAGGSGQEEQILGRRFRLNEKFDVHRERGTCGFDAQERDPGCLWWKVETRNVGNYFKELRNYGRNLQDTMWILFYFNWRHLDVFIGERGHCFSPSRRGIWSTDVGNPHGRKRGRHRTPGKPSISGAGVPRSPQSLRLLVFASFGFHVTLWVFSIHSSWMEV